MIKRTAIAALAFATILNTNALAGSPDELNDLEIAHVAYTADIIDIRYAHLALAISDNADVQAFAETMIRDHEAVNELALALLKKLDAQPQDNFLSMQLTDRSVEIIHELSELRGVAFDRKYAQNELGYHQAVNKLVEFSFIPNFENNEVKALFKQALIIFKTHEKQAVKLVDSLVEQGS